MGIKIRNVDRRSALRKLAIPVTSISSCDTQRIMCPFAGSVDSLVFHCTAAITNGNAGIHWTVKSIAGTTLLDVNTSAAIAASAVVKLDGNPINFTAGSVLEINTSSTANFAPVAVAVIVNLDSKEN